MDILNILIALLAASIFCIISLTIRLHQIEKLKEDWKQLAFKGVAATLDLMELLKKKEEEIGQTICSFKE